jgi:metallo-beta-lactamase class B
MNPIARGHTRPSPTRAGRTARDPRPARRSSSSSSLTWAAVVLCLFTTATLAAQVRVGGSPREPAPPFRVIGNIHYVGSSNAGSFLITTPAGHILIDSGYPRTESWVRDSIEQLGFRVSDIKVILNTHAHADHVGAHAQFKEWTGARVLTSEADAPVLADGGRSDFRSDGRELWRPIAPDGVIRHGDEVGLGGVTLVAQLTPGHTRGNTTWTMVVEEEGRKYDVIFVGSMGLSEGVPLVGNAKYPQIADDYARSFDVLKTLPCDVFLAFHAHHFGLEEKKRRLEAGEKPNPFIDPEGFRAYIEKNEAAFLDRLAQERRPSAAARVGRM